MPGVILLQLLPPVRFDLRFARRNDGVGMRTEKHVPQPFGGDECGSSAFDSQFLEFLAAHTLKFVRGKRSVAREIIEHRE